MGIVRSCVRVHSGIAALPGRCIFLCAQHPISEVHDTAYHVNAIAHSHVVEATEHVLMPLQGYEDQQRFAHEVGRGKGV